MGEPGQTRSSLGETQMQSGAEARRREIAVEHLLFQTLVHLERTAPGLLDHLEGSIARLGDPAGDETKDDEAVRAVARRFVEGLRRQAAG